MKIDYRIDGEPNSVALWISPADGPIDLFEFSELRIHAKSTVRSFTIVAEDESSQGDGSAEGVADTRDEGVTDQRQEFRLPLRDFRRLLKNPIMGCRPRMPD